MSAELFQTLREQMPEGRVVIPGDQGYEEALERWSATMVKPAVSEKRLAHDTLELV